MTVQPKIRVLVAEDVELLRRLLSTIIRGDEDLVLVGEVTDGHAAVSAIETAHPDVLCLNLGMPGIDGLQVMERMQALPHKPAVVIVSGQGTPDNITAAQELGAYTFINKPIVPGKVLAAIKAAARNRSST